MKLHIEITTETLMDGAIIEEAINNLNLKHVSMQISHMQENRKPAKRGYTKKHPMMDGNTTLRLLKTDAKGLSGNQLHAYQALLRRWGADPTKPRRRSAIMDVLAK